MNFEWKSLCPVPTKRVFSTPVDVNGKLYILGGCDVRGMPVRKVECYDPLENTWSPLESMPTRRAGTCALAVGKKIVVLGGINTSQKPVNVVEIFDAESNKWLFGESLVEELLGLTGVVRDDKIVVVGGMGSDNKAKDYLMEYDISRNKWKILPSMPTPRYATFTALVGNKLYVLGGRQGKLPMKAFEAFDFQENQWITLPEIPSGRVFSLLVHNNNYIYSLGGLNEDHQEGFSDVTEIFDIDKGEWLTAAPMLTKRGDFAAACLEGRIIVAGGLGNKGVPLRDAEVYDRTSDVWTSLPELPTPHCSCAYVNFQQKLHIISGLSIGGPTANVEVLQAKSDS